MNDSKDRMSIQGASHGERLFERRRLLDVVAMMWDDHNSPPLESLCRDISTSGILLEAQDSLPIGKYLRISLHNRQNQEHMHALYTRVARVQKNKWGGYNVGLVVIHDISPPVAPH